VSETWTHAVVVDPRELRQLTAEITRLRGLRQRHRSMVGAVLALCGLVAGGLGFQSMRLTMRTNEVREQRTEVREQRNAVREHRKISRRANTALRVLTRSHDQILAATVQAPSVGTKSWGRRFTVTKYLPRSAAYGKDNDGLTSTMMKADPDARIIAVDPQLIPYGSGGGIEDLGWYQAQDCGSAIKGFRLDVMTATEDDAMSFGKQDRFVIVVPGERSLG
jgi:3D (Asp-Asp-Asp) domain-containing protein